MTEHVYTLEARVSRPMFAKVKIDGLDEFEVTTTPDWWPEAPRGFHTPHESLVASSASCLLVSMFRSAKAMHVEFKDASVRAKGIMGEHEGIWRFDEIQLVVNIVIEDENLRRKAERVVELAHKSCPIANTLKCQNTVETEVVVE
jgi:uncharacterized OsmC-like protein